MGHHHYWADAQAERPPRFSMVGVLFACIGLYYLLTVFLMLFVWAKALSGPMIAEHISHAGNAGVMTTADLSIPSFFLFTAHSPARVRGIVNLLRVVSIIALLAVVFSHFPLSALFMRRRRGKSVPARLQERAEELAVRSARTTAALCLLAAACDAAIHVIKLAAGSGIASAFAFRSIPFYVVVVALISFFVYYWQNHRITIVFAPFIFTGPASCNPLPGPTARASGPKCGSPRPLRRFFPWRS